MRIDPEPGSPIGAALRSGRVALDMSQGVLADMIGISVSYLSRIERGESGFDTDWIIRLPVDIQRRVKAALEQEVQSIPVGYSKVFP